MTLTSSWLFADPCTQEVIKEVFAGPAYSSTVLKEGPGALDYLHELAKRQEAGEDLRVCCEMPESVADSTVSAATTTDISMFGTASLLAFATLLGDATIDMVVEVLYTLRNPAVGHIVVLGPGRLQLCSCLQVLRTGLPCRHLFAVLLWTVKRPSDFNGFSLHPRWRSSADAWSMDDAGFPGVRVDGWGPRSGFTDDVQMGGGDGGDEGGGMIARDFVEVARGRNYANLLAMCTASVKLLCDNFDPKTPAFQAAGLEIFARMARDVSAHVQSKESPSDSLVVDQLRDPPRQPSKSRKESRVIGACEGGPKKKMKGTG